MAFSRLKFYGSTYQTARRLKIIIETQDACLCFEIVGDASVGESNGPIHEFFGLFQLVGLRFVFAPFHIFDDELCYLMLYSRNPWK